MKTVNRPEFVGPKINCYDEFELCYLRHQYIRKTPTNPTSEQMEPFNRIVRNYAYRTYYAYLGLFKSVGMEIEDVVSIGKTQLIYFLGCESIQIPEHLDEFVDRFMEVSDGMPSSAQILDKDKADFTLFLKQRMTDLVRICRQKVRNIRGQLAEEFLVFYGPKEPPENHGILVKNFGKMGFKKLDIGKFKSLKRKMVPKEEGPVYQINGLYYVTIPLDHRQLTLEDLSGAGLNPYDSIHNMNPEDVLLQIQTEEEFQKNKKRWYSTPRDLRIKQIKDFILAKGNDPRYTEEVKTAYKMIKE